MPPRRSTRRRAKATSQKSNRISKRQAVQPTEDEIDVEEVKIKQEEVDENDNVADDSERSPEKLKGDEDDTLDDKSRVVAFVKREMDGILEENLNFNGNEAANQNSVEKETPSASDEVVKSLEHLDGISRVQEGGDNEGNSDNVMKSLVHMDNCSRDQESGDKEEKGANGVKNDYYNEDNNAIQSPGHMNDFCGIQEGGDGEGKSADKREETDNVKDGEHSKGKNVMKSPGQLDKFFRVREGGDEEGKKGDNVENDEDNSVIKSPAHMDDTSGVQEGGAEEGKATCERENIDGVKDKEGNKVNNFMKSPGHADKFIGVQDDGDEEMKSADDMEDGDGEYNKVMESLGYLDDFSRVQEVSNEEGKSACKGENVDCAKDNEVNNGMESTGPAGESIGDQDGDDEELRSADGMEDDGDGEDNKLMESLGHLDECTDVQEGCDEEGNIADDMEDNEDSDDTEEVEDHSLTSSGKQRQQEIHVTSVHVKGLVKSWNVKKLEELCKQYGEIVNVWLPRNFGARHKDFGFIAFSSHKSALACVEGINNTQLVGETKVKADLAKTRFRGVMQKKGRWGKQHAKFEEVEAEIKAQVHGDKFKGTRKRGRGIAKEESQAPSLLNITKEGKPNNHRTGFSEGQNASPVKTACKIKNLPQKRNDSGKRKIEHDYNNRQSKKSRGNAQGRQINRYSARKPHSKEGNRSISGSKRHQLDMEPHAGYIEPATRKPARHYAGYAEATHWHQGQSHSSYLEHTFQNQSPSVRYARPGFGRQSLPHAGYIEPAAETHGFVANDYSLRRAGGYSGQGNQGSAYVRVMDSSRDSDCAILSICYFNHFPFSLSMQPLFAYGGRSASPPSRAQNYTSYTAYQGFAGVSRYHHSSRTYLPRQQYY
ncbi:NUCLEOLIN-LIKE ISOFORM X1 [Salix purpurea]|uniref:NUCLEOLIN-LIKE ISOFORM X1 n=1 Tax=Salix purpurea TaxID=77065 RepID=A0A9Q1A7X4_SALPP|nr:NUCLEOLIN-LIKE ISOFORM X1 [Salix purpurea]